MQNPQRFPEDLGIGAILRGSCKSKRGRINFNQSFVRKGLRGPVHRTELKVLRTMRAAFPPINPPGPHAEETGALPRSNLTGCPWHDVKSMLRGVGLRPTLQRMALGWIMFGKGPRHLTAEMLYEEASWARVPVSLATVYNTLHQFTEVGLLRQVLVAGSKTYFDTNISEHHHFFIEDRNEVLDIPEMPVRIEALALPNVPEGYEVSRIDVVVRLRPKGD
jgi:Fur family iron response transcriptional regulator